MSVSKFSAVFGLISVALLTCCMRTRNIEPLSNTSKTKFVLGVVNGKTQLRLGGTDYALTSATATFPSPLSGIYSISRNKIVFYGGTGFQLVCTFQFSNDPQNEHLQLNCPSDFLGKSFRGSYESPSDPSCKFQRPDPSYVCMQECGLPVISASDSTPPWRWYSPEDVQNRQNYGCPI